MEPQLDSMITYVNAPIHLPVHRLLEHVSGCEQQASPFSYISLLCDRCLLPLLSGYGVLCMKESWVSKNTATHPFLQKCDFRQPLPL